MAFTQNSIPYLEQLGKAGRVHPRLQEIAAAVERTGIWEDKVEWRIFTVAQLRVDKIDREGKPWYRVSVKCDHEMVCVAPTLERAVEFLGVYEHLVRDLFWTLGWPSWASPKKPEP